MPLYEYQCEACAHRFEVIQKFSDHPIETCPKCGGVVRKLLSSPAIQFKGTGWYITDYARSGKSEGKSESKSEGQSETGKADKPAETPAPAAAESKSEKKADAKPAASATKTDA